MRVFVLLIFLICSGARIYAQKHSTLLKFELVPNNEVDKFLEVSTDLLADGLCYDSISVTPNVGQMDSVPLIGWNKAEGAELLQKKEINIPDSRMTQTLAVPEGKISYNSSLREREVNSFYNEEIGKVKKSVPSVNTETGVADIDGSQINPLPEVDSETLARQAEQQALKADELPELQKEGFTASQFQLYKQALEQYKEEKRIRKELEKKVREVANDAVGKNQRKVDEVMGKVKGSARKYSEVQDLRKLPQRASNPMKALSWRERIVPGFTFQFSENSLTWLEFDPQVFYKISGNWSAGLGGMYRFAMHKRPFGFDHFDNMYGAKVFTQYHVFKGFFLRSEGQFAAWKAWTPAVTDPAYRNKTYITCVGIGKEYPLTKRIRGNVQTLYQFHEGADPYKSRVMFRVGFDFSLRKKEVRDWQKVLKNKLNELERGA